MNDKKHSGDVDFHDPKYNEFLRSPMEAAAERLELMRGYQSQYSGKSIAIFTESRLMVPGIAPGPLGEVLSQVRSLTQGATDAEKKLITAVSFNKSPTKED